MSLRSDPEKMRTYKREWAKKNRERQRKYDKRTQERAFKILGNKCTYCGCDDRNALELNHKSGGGREARRKYGRNRKRLFFDIIAGRERGKDLELTCRVCNAWHYLVKLKGVEDKWTITYG